MTTTTTTQPTGRPCDPGDQQFGTQTFYTMWIPRIQNCYMCVNVVCFVAVDNLSCIGSASTTRPAVAMVTVFLSIALGLQVIFK